MDGVLLLPDTQSSRAGLGNQPRSAPKGRHRVEGEQGQPGFFPLTGDYVPARGRGANEYVLKVSLHEVGDVAVLFATAPFDVSWNRQQADLDSIFKTPLATRVPAPSSLEDTVLIPNMEEESSENGGGSD